MNILLCVTGSVAAALTPQLHAELSKHGTVRIAATEHSFHFWKPSPDMEVWRDADEWKAEGYVRGSDIAHIALRSWADVVVIAPLAANSLAKLSHGIADNLVTSVLRAWQIGKPIVLAPAMNTAMWEHPATAEQLAALARWHGDALQVVQPVSKKLACGDVGIGAMAPVADIAAIVRTTVPS